MISATKYQYLGCAKIWYPRVCYFPSFFPCSIIALGEIQISGKMDQKNISSASQQFAGAMMAQECTSCAAGKHAYKVGSAACAKCLPGYYSALGATLCDRCGDGGGERARLWIKLGAGCVTGILGYYERSRPWDPG